MWVYRIHCKYYTAVDDIKPIPFHVMISFIFIFFFYFVASIMCAKLKGQQTCTFVIWGAVIVTIVIFLYIFVSFPLPLHITRCIARYSSQSSEGFKIDKLYNLLFFFFGLNFSISSLQSKVSSFYFFIPFFIFALSGNLGI